MKKKRMLLLGMTLATGISSQVQAQSAPPIDKPIEVPQAVVVYQTLMATRHNSGVEWAVHQYNSAITCNETFLGRAYIGEQVDFTVSGKDRNTNVPYNSYNVTIRDAITGVVLQSYANVTSTQTISHSFADKGLKQIIATPVGVSGVTLTGLLVVMPVTKVYATPTEMCMFDYPGGNVGLTLQITPAINSWAYYTPTFDYPAFDVVTGAYQGCQEHNPMLYLQYGNYELRGETISGPVPTVPAPTATVDAASMAATIGSGGGWAGSADMFRFRDMLSGALVQPGINVLGSTLKSDFYDIDLSTEYGSNHKIVWDRYHNPAYDRYLSNDGKLRLERDLIIPAGYELTIRDMDIEFTEAGRVLVQSARDGQTPGGILKLENSTLTAYKDCDGNTNNMWQGVEVWGDKTRSQHEAFSLQDGYNNTIYGPSQAQIVMNNSTISYAQNAIRPFNSEDVSGKANGGIIAVSGSTFMNNRRDVEFMQYRNYSPSNQGVERPYRASFVNTTFTSSLVTTNPYLTHITGWAVKGVTISGCTFDNSAIYSPNSQNKKPAVSGIDFGVRITPSYNRQSDFRSFGNAVELSNIGSGTTFEVSNTNFGNTHTGIQSNGAMAPTIQYNTIEADRVGGFTGISINTGSGFNIRRNTIKGQLNGFPFFLKGAGVVVSNSGSDDNVVKYNTFNTLQTGALSNYINKYVSPQGFNKGLEFYCNTSVSTGIDMAARGNNAGTNGVKATQGSSNLPAGNVFAIGQTGHTYDIYNPSAEVGGVSYFYNPSAPSNQIPTTNLGVVNTVQGASFNNCDEIPVQYPDINTPLGMLRRLLIDSNGMGERDSIYWAAEHWGNESPYGSLLLADLKLEDGAYSEANGVYNLIVNQHGLVGEEALEFSNYGRKLMDLKITMLQADRPLNLLEPAEVSTLEYIADNATMWARVRAQAWLQLFDGRDIAFNILWPEEEGGSMARKAKPAQSLPAYSVYPNPAAHTLTVRYSNIAATGKLLVIRDLLGRQLYTRALEGSNGELSVPVNQWANGLYLYQVEANGKVLHQGRFTKQQ